ncbi:hypothetical protein EG68_09528, partial [Paragonimus skrjabini miyazakii]
PWQFIQSQSYSITGIEVAATSAVYYLPSIQTDRPKLLVLYQNSALRLWDLKTEQSLASLQLIPANGSSSDLTPSDPQVFCLACPQLRSSYERATHDRDLLAVGGAGTIYVVVVKETAPADCSYTAKCITAFDTGDNDSVEAVDFAWTHPFFAFATVGGMIGIVDTVKLRMRQKWLYTDENSLAVGLTCLRWSCTMPIFFTATTTGAVVSWPGVCGLTEIDTTGFTKAPEPLAVFWGHRAMVLDLALAPSSSVISSGQSGSSTGDTLVEPFIASASDDSTIRLFSLNSLRMPATR